MIPGGWTVGLLLMLGLLFAALRWMNSGHAKYGPDPDRGGSGYSPADLRPLEPRPLDGPSDARERWLLGLAAPFVELHGLHHGAWALAPPGPDAAWERRLGEVVDAAGARGHGGWRALLDRARTEYDAAASTGGLPPDPAGLAWAAARLAFVYRLGVAAGHLEEEQARQGTQVPASGVVRVFGDWLAFGDAFTSGVEGFGTMQDRMRLKAYTRALYGPGGPWEEPAWPAAPGGI
ncbi:DUF1266 domain-containing protein [Zafaria sp. Z1313]|uniref:DUF1266 domain-containing protein n=1 Tax=Zafaria sp. Z1313 TaxID=3423202 RepID=UPI003D301968